MKKKDQNQENESASEKLAKTIANGLNMIAGIGHFFFKVLIITGSVILIKELQPNFNLGIILVMAVMGILGAIVDLIGEE